MYFVRSLRKLNVDHKIICMFYNSVVSSVLLYAISCFYDACNEKLKRDICKFPKRMCKMTDAKLKDCIEEPSVIYTHKCIALLSRMINDHTHPLHFCLTVLPHGRLNMPYCRTSRFHNTFIPSTVKMYNNM